MNPLVPVSMAVRYIRGGTAMVICAPPVSVRMERHPVHLNTVWWSVKMPLIFHISVVPSAQVYIYILSRRTHS